MSSTGAENIHTIYTLYTHQTHHQNNKQGIAETEWLERDVLEELGFGKLCTELDMKEAAKAGLLAKPLTAANVQKHLEDVGIEAEFGTHSHMRGLSGGQKVC